MTENNKSKKNLALSFSDSIKGLRIFSHERNLIIQLCIGIIVLIFAFALPLAKLEQIIIILLTGSVLAVEMINTILEKILDHLHPEHHENIALIKDAMATVVLIVVIIVIVIGFWIFLPYILSIVVF